MPVRLFIIVTCCENFGIGFNGTVPWKLENNQEQFTNLTIGNPPYNRQNAVIMGRKTYLSLPKPRLKEGRVNIVLSTDLVSLSRVTKKNVFMCNSFKALVDMLNTTLSRFVNIAWVIGGESMFKWALRQPYCERIYMTWIKKKFKCDAFFPTIPKKFVKTVDSSVPQGEQQEDGIKYEYRVYENILIHNEEVKFMEEPGEHVGWMLHLPGILGDDFTTFTTTRPTFTLKFRRFWDPPSGE